MALGNAKTPDKRKSYSNEKNLFFSEKIRSRRLDLKMKQAELAAKAEMTQAQISELEGGRFVDTAQRIISLARALETTPDYLFGFRDEP